jgi:hypothetical protein
MMRLGITNSIITMNNKFHMEIVNNILVFKVGIDGKLCNGTISKDGDAVFNNDAILNTLGITNFTAWYDESDGGVPDSGGYNFDCPIDLSDAIFSYDGTGDIQIDHDGNITVNSWNEDGHCYYDGILTITKTI